MLSFSKQGLSPHSLSVSCQTQITTAEKKVTGLSGVLNVCRKDTHTLPNNEHSLS